MPAIRLLPDTLINRIAAGEVIERPAAAAKELVENALDAGARRISVLLVGGGIDRIEIIDDGCGIAEADLPLAVQRHATSKLDCDQLIRITTLGFRGEALPAIGAAARLEITSRPAGADHAARIAVDGGRIEPPRPCAGPPGTRVVVRDLFHATPARRKFLRHPRTEGDHAEAAVRRLALAAPGVAMRMELDGRLAFDLPAQDRRARVVALLGAEAAAVLLPVDGERGPARLGGYCCAPTLHRPTGAAQSLVVNGRPVTDPVLKAAIRVAYRDVIVAGRHAVVALFLDLPPDEVDVNVHPAKTELRFRDGAAIRGLVIGALGRAIGGGAGREPPGGPGTFAAPMPHAAMPAAPIGLRPSPGIRPPPPAGPRFAGLADSQLPLGDFPAARVLLDAPAPRADQPLGAPVAQVLDCYVVAVAADGGLVLVDQHAAHERLTHEALRSQMSRSGIRAQRLLVPAVVELAPAQLAHLVERAGELASLGLEVEPFGSGAVLVRALPALLGAPDPAPLLRDMAEELAELGESVSLATRLDAVIARLACHGSIRAGRRLTVEEMSALLRQMEATPRASTCSHGRPTFLKFERGQIERMFGRT